MKIACLLVFAAFGVEYAGPATFQFSGTVTQVPIDDVFGDILAYDLFSGTFTFDTAALDLIPADSSSGSYTVGGPPFGMSATVSGHIFSTSDSLNVSVVNSFVDQYAVQAQTNTGDLTLQLLLQDDAATSLSNDSLSASPPLLANFAIRDFHLVQTLADGRELQVDGQITEFGFASGQGPQSTAPEPSSAVLLAIAFSVLASRCVRSAYEGKKP